MSKRMIFDSSYHESREEMKASFFRGSQRAHCVKEKILTYCLVQHKRGTVKHSNK